MREDEKRENGILFDVGDPELREQKLHTHDLCTRYNQTFEGETEKRQEMLRAIFAEIGEGAFLQGPIFIHYGCHTSIGRRFFGNFNLTIQDDTRVTIGDNCDFGPNVTIVTPVHPMLPGERRGLRTKTGAVRQLCYAKPVIIGNDCWLGANVVVCPGVTIGDGCVIGAGSTVVRDIPPMSFAAGNPCKVIRPIGEGDSMRYRPELLGENSTLPEGER